MAATVATSASAALAITTSVVVNKPASTADGDFLVAVVGFESNTATVNSVPSGWNLGRGPVRSVNATLYYYYKVASSEPTSWTWGISASVVCGGGVARITGSQNAIAVDDEGTDANDSTGDFTGGVTPTLADSLLIMMTIATQSGVNHSGWAITTSNPTWSTAFNLGVTNTTTLSLVYANRPEVTGTGDWTVTVDDDNTGDSVSFLLALGPRTDVTVPVGVQSVVTSVLAPTVTGGATVSPAVVGLVASIPAPTVSTPAPKWTNPDKSTAPSWTNPDKS